MTFSFAGLHWLADAGSAGGVRSVAVDGRTKVQSPCRYCPASVWICQGNWTKMPLAASRGPVVAHDMYGRSGVPASATVNPLGPIDGSSCVPSNVTLPDAVGAAWLVASTRLALPHPATLAPGKFTSLCTKSA